MKYRSLGLGLLLGSCLLPGCKITPRMETEPVTIERKLVEPDECRDRKKNVITRRNYRECLEVIAGKPAVIYFWAEWCPPCKEFNPAYEKLSQQYGDRLIFLTVDLTTDTIVNKLVMDKLKMKSDNIPRIVLLDQYMQALAGIDFDHETADKFLNAFYDLE